MSRLAGGRPIIASRTTFDALVVDSGEESEEEVVDVPQLETLVLSYLTTASCAKHDIIQFVPG